MKMDKKQSHVLQGEVKVLKDTVWRLTTRVYGLEEHIKEIRCKLKLGGTFDSRHVTFSPQLVTASTSPIGGRTSRTSSRTPIQSNNCFPPPPNSRVPAPSRTPPSINSRPPPTTSRTPPSSSRTQNSRDKESPKPSSSGSRYNKNRATPGPGPKSKTRSVAVKKTGGGSVSGSKSQNLQSHTVITQRGRRATSFKLQPSDGEKEIVSISDSDDDHPSPKKSKVSHSLQKSIQTQQQKPIQIVQTKTVQAQPSKSATTTSQDSSAAEDFMKVLNEYPSVDYVTIEGHADLIVFPSSDLKELNINSDGTISMPSEQAEELVDSDQLPLKKRKLEAATLEHEYAEPPECAQEMEILSSQPGEEELVNDSVLQEIVVTSYKHRPPETFNCFFCNEAFPTDEERAVHTRIHTGIKKEKF